MSLYYISKHTDKDISITGLSCYLHTSNVDYHNRTAEVTYDLDIEHREWGIKSITHVPVRFTASIEWVAYIDDLTISEVNNLLAYGHASFDSDVIIGTITIDTATDPSWEVIMEVEFRVDGSFMINEIEIDFKNKKIIIE